MAELSATGAWVSASVAEPATAAPSTSRAIGPTVEAPHQHRAHQLAPAVTRPEDQHPLALVAALPLSALTAPAVGCARPRHDGQRCCRRGEWDGPRNVGLADEGIAEEDEHTRGAGDGTEQHHLFQAAQRGPTVVQSRAPSEGHVDRGGGCTDPEDVEPRDRLCRHIEPDGGEEAHGRDPRRRIEVRQHRQSPAPQAGDMLM